MENKSELFDLRREKRELDAFLSTIAEASEPHPSSEVVQPEEALSFSTDSQSVPEPAARKSSTMRLDLPALELEETPAEPIREERALMPADSEVTSRISGSIVSGAPEKTVPEIETASSFMPPEEEKKADVFSEIGDAPRRTPVERFAKASRFDETSKIDETFVSRSLEFSESLETEARPEETVKPEEQAPTEAPPREEKQILEKPAPEKRKEKKTGAYDFAPEKTSTGIGKWVWIVILIIVLIALLVGYFWLYPERGSKTVNLIKSYIPISQTDQRAVPAAVPGINLTQVRQKLVYNTTLKKNIRVLEGVAENITPRPVSRIKIVANLYNAEGTVLASTETFCGNIIIDEKLESLDAGGIMSALKDTKTMEDRIQPKGQIPFMVVFAGEPAGVFRLSVVPAEFKQH